MKSLRRLAAAHGVLTSYYGTKGLCRARPDALLAVLAALGAPVRDFGDVDGALHRRKEELARRILEPVVVLWQGYGAPPSLTFHPPPWTSSVLTVSVVTEDGGTYERRHVIEDLQPEGAGRRHRRRLPLPELQPGYHHLALGFGVERVESVLFVAPRHAYRRGERAPSERAGRWGLFAPLYGLTSDESWGAGDFSDLIRLADLTARHGGDFIQTLPLLATFADEPSPYSPVSRLFWNELYVDPRRTPEWRSVARDLEPRIFEKLEPLEREPLLDYAALQAVKRPVLEAISREARRLRPGALEAFASRRPEALDYARFRAARERGGPAPRTRAPRPVRLDLGDDLVLYHLHGQMTAEAGLSEVSIRAAASGVRLYFDLPLGVHPHGFDTWRERSLFAEMAEVGAPPDAVFPDGQTWGFPPILPERGRLDGHRYFRESLQRAMSHADVLRIDHVMGLHRQFWVPRGVEKRDGVYVRYPAEELYAAASIESHRHRCEIVGENLGIVPPGVNQCLDRHRFRGIHVLQFGLTGRDEAPAAPPPAGVVASLNTHDTPTFAGFCRFRDIDARVEAGLLDADEGLELMRWRGSAIASLDAALGVSPNDARERLERWLLLLLRSEAEMVAITLEDLWLEEEPQNVPGRVDLPNWRRKLAHGLSSLPPDAVATLEKLSGRRGS